MGENRERINTAPSFGTSRTSGNQLTETLAAGRTITLAELDQYPYITFDPDGSARTVTLPAEAASKGAQLLLKNSAGATPEIITVNNDAAAAVLTLDFNEACLLWCDGTTWNGGVLPEIVGGIAVGELTIAEGNILIGNSGGVGVALDVGATDGGLLIGNGTTGTVAAVTGPVALSNAGLSSVAVMATENVVGGIPVVHWFTVDGGANDAQDITLTHKTKIIDFVVRLDGAGTAGGAVTLKNAGTAISDVIDISSGGDEDLFRPLELDNAQVDVAAAAVLTVTTASSGGDCPALQVFVTGIRVA